MRAIIARESRKARAERAAAQAAIRAQRAATPAKGAAWRAKAEPKRKPSPAAIALADLAAERAKASDRDWRARNPAAAETDRRLRATREATHERWSHKHEGTPETHDRAHRRGALARLHASGAIDANQLGWALEIAEAAERIGADVRIRTASLETRIDTQRIGDGGFFEALGRVRMEVAYGRWRARAAGPIGALLEMIVEDIGCTIVARRYGMHNRRARKLLIDALDLWPRVYGEARREIGAAELAAAQAGLS